MRLTFVVALIVAGLGQTARAQPFHPEKLSAVCHQVLGRLGQLPGSSPYFTWVEQALYEASGADVDDDLELVRQKVKALFAKQLSLGRRDSRLYCDHAIAGLETTLLGFAVHTRKWNEVADMVRLGVDPNWVDPRTGRTALDDHAERLETYLVNTHRTGSPAGRTNFPPDVEELEQYWRLRDLGLRHKDELSDLGAELCPPGPEDAPAPGVPFTGKLATSGGGPSPQTIPGVRTVSAWQTACLINHLQHKLVRLAAMTDAEGIPGSYGVAWAASGDDFTGKAQLVLEEVARRVTGGGDEHKSRPIVVYCHHEKCLLSYNVLLRLRHAGFTHLYWLRAGLKDWKHRGLPLEPVRATLE